MKLAIAVLSDPKPGSEESLGGLFNGLASLRTFIADGYAIQVF